jgi:hypothetical protein
MSRRNNSFRIYLAGLLEISANGNLGMLIVAAILLAGLMFGFSDLQGWNLP